MSPAKQIQSFSSPTVSHSSDSRATGYARGRRSGTLYTLAHTSPNSARQPWNSVRHQPSSASRDRVRRRPAQRPITQNRSRALRWGRPSVRDVEHPAGGRHEEGVHGASAAATPPPPQPHPVLLSESHDIAASAPSSTTRCRSPAFRSMGESLRSSAMSHLASRSRLRLS